MEIETTPNFIVFLRSDILYDFEKNNDFFLLLELSASLAIKWKELKEDMVMKLPLAMQENLTVY